MQARKRRKQAGKKEQRQTCKEANVGKEKDVKEREKSMHKNPGKHMSAGQDRTEKGAEQDREMEAARGKEGKAIQGRQMGTNRHT
jgi:hypothetical protein